MIEALFTALKIIGVVVILLIATVWIVYENKALREQNQPKDGDTE